MDQGPEEEDELNLSKWDQRFLGLAEHVAQWSLDPSTKVGAVVVGRTNNLVAVGFNGLPPGLKDDDRLEDRAWKLEHVVHAEMNALANCTFEPVQLFVTHPCCHRCAVHILSHRTVRRIVTLCPEGFMERWGESVERTRAVFTEAGVAFQTIPE